MQLFGRLPSPPAIPVLRLQSRASESPASSPSVLSSEVPPKCHRVPTWAPSTGSRTSSASSSPLALFHTGSTACCARRSALDLFRPCADAPVATPRASIRTSGKARRRGDMAAVGPCAGGRVPWGPETNLPGLCLFNNPPTSCLLASGPAALLQPVRGLQLDASGLEQPRDLVGIEMVLLA